MKIQGDFFFLFFVDLLYRRWLPSAIFSRKFKKGHREREINYLIREFVISEI